MMNYNLHFTANKLDTVIIYSINTNLSITINSDTVSVQGEVTIDDLSKVKDINEKYIYKYVDFDTYYSINELFKMVHSGTLNINIKILR